MHLTVTSIIGVVLVLSESITALQWTLLHDGAGTPSSPSRRRDAAIGVTADGSKIVLFGGRDSSDSLNSTWIFDIGVRRWESVPVASSWPNPRYSMVYGMVGTVFYIVTGQGTGGDDGLFNDIWQFDSGSSTWTDLTTSYPTRPQPRYGCGGGLFNHSHTLYLSHGFSNEKRYSDVWRLRLPSPSSNPTAEVVYEDKHPYGPTYPHRRCLSGWGPVAKDQFAIYGGCASGGGTGGNCPAWDSWIYRDSTRDWKQLPNCASPRIYSSMGLMLAGSSTDEVVPILYGGREDVSQVLEVDEADAAEIAVLDLAEFKWRLKKSAPETGGVIPVKRFGAAMTSDFKGNVFMFGGRAVSDGQHLNDLWMLSGEPLSAPDTGYSCGGPFLSFFTVTMLHVMFMFIAWSMFLPAGVFIARYLRGKDPLWFHLHRAFQLSGLAFAVAGFVCAVVSFALSDHFNFFHGGLGLFIMLLGLQQPFNALVRPHKEKGQPVERNRWLWELWHKNSGRLALMLSVVQISMGLFLEVAGVATVTLWYVYVLAWIILILVFEVRLRLKMKSAPVAQSEDVALNGTR